MSDPYSSSRLTHTQSASTSKTADTIIIVPCFNEADRLNADAFVDFALTNAGLKFLFVDDGSNDGTLARLAGLQIRAPHVIDVLALATNSGKAEAVRQGFLQTFESGAQRIGYFDADLATPLEAITDLQRVLDRLSDIEIVFGSRQPGLGRLIYRNPMRRVVSGVCAGLARLATGLPFSDTQCGAKLFRNTPALKAAISEPFRSGWLFDVELVLRLIGSDHDTKRRFYDLPLMQWSEVPGSKIKIQDVFQSGFVMLSLIARRWGIKSEFRQKSVQQDILSAPTVAFHDSFTLQDVAYLKTRWREHGDFVQIDLTHVETFGPSVLSALLGICDQMALEGRRPRILLPTDPQVCAMARRTGLSALFECRRVIPPKIDLAPGHSKTKKVA